MREDRGERGEKRDDRRENQCHAVRLVQAGPGWSRLVQAGPGWSKLD